MDKKIKCKSLIIEGTKYRTHLTKKFENRTNWEKPDERKIISFIPGTITKLNIKKGQKIKKGQVLFILEAMKMKNKVCSPLSSKIKEVYVKNGESISKNQIILEFE
ncbi:MAG: biotin/lipoyl-binding protein [Chlorobi bacterium]|nr:biotin/lipoyl-binding protein [Chlorobiota bacterium]